MKHAYVTTVSFLLFLVIFIIRCTEGQGPMGRAGEQGPQGEAGANGLAPVYYSSWIQAKTWVGQDSAWTFSVNDTIFNEQNIETGVILAYARISGDIKDSTTRPLPCFVRNAFWSFFVDSVDQIKFTTTLATTPDTNNYFRYVVIHTSDTMLIESNKLPLNLHEISYQQFCQKYHIPR